MVDMTGPASRAFPAWYTTACDGKSHKSKPLLWLCFLLSVPLAYDS